MEGSVLDPVWAVCPLLPSPGLEEGHTGSQIPPCRMGRHTGAASRQLSIRVQLWG